MKTTSSAVKANGFKGGCAVAALGLLSFKAGFGQIDLVVTGAEVREDFGTSGLQLAGGGRPSRHASQF